MGISFYFDTLAEVDEFYVFMKNLKKEEPEGFFLYMADETPDYLK